ncbi:DHH family phosphoesterase [Saliphagus sp. LR7]|uniref:DHH family phosphoesterase n=1 Tax=Saliphagus sp. LR7 TaxID=2282654 RepID=UPI000DF8659D|nr:OB-fold nucleic acid binding domain-containing protein [Saliphagus sp. LR7]
MGNCIICGTSVEGVVCTSHQEDVAFEFEGTSASQLTPERYYRGTVDGYADFGVFVDVGDHVTGLLHRSELKQRLESLDWEPGDSVYVQVLDVRDNGNVDLGWSIRQDDREFRGTVIDAPDGDRLPEDDGSEEEDEEPTTHADSPAAGDPTSGPDDPVANGGTEVETAATPEEAVDVESEPTETPPESDPEAEGYPTDEDGEPTLNPTTVDSLADQVGAIVRLEGEITSVRQTSGPTVFELRDETGAVECAAFEEAGVRAYPDVDVDEIVALEGEVERHHGDLQVETERLEPLSGEDRETVADRLVEAVEREARPAAVSLLADHDAVADLEEEVVEAATAIRRAVMEARPIVVRHTATADGYVAGAGLERAILPLIRAKHAREDAEYHYFERRPLDDAVYDMDAATGDATSMLEARDRHGEQLPLVVLADAGSTAESADGYELLENYGADRLVIDDGRGDGAVAEAVSVAVGPAFSEAAEGDAEITTTALAANVAAHVNDDAREDLAHLPAISYWEGVPEAYADLASEAGYDDTARSERREAIALEAHYQSYSDKRELIADLLFDGGSGLAGHISEQFRDKLGDELETVRSNVDRREAEGVPVTVLDTDAYTHRFDFPPTGLLLDALSRVEREEHGEETVTIGVDEDELHVRSTDPVDVRALGAAIESAVPEGGVRVVGGPDGYVAFLVGEREGVIEAAVAAVGDLADE